MRLKSFFFIIILFSVLVRVPAQTSQTPSHNLEKVRIERLAGLAKIWGAVKYFHPFLAYREIDWDKTLIETIPKVNAAKTTREYEAAINSMLAPLGDRNTRARIIGEKPKTENQAPAAENKEPIRLENGVLMIDSFAAAKAIAGANNLRSEFLTKTTQFISQAKAILIDLRSGAGLDEEIAYYLGFYLQESLPLMLDKNVPTASVRYRIHNGYAPQSGSTSGGYYSGLIADAPQTLAGNNKGKTPPIVFLVNENSPAVTEILGGLQAANLAFVVQDGESAEETGVATYAIKLPENVEVKMRTTELVGADGTIGFAADVIAPKGDAEKTAQRIIAENKFISKRVKNASANASQVSQKDNIYPEMEFPTPEYRLLALFRFWNVINLFFPYKHLIDKPWDNILPPYIAKFEANKDAADYQLTVREMVAEIQDSHGGVRFPSISKSAERLGRFSPPFTLKFIENQTVVEYVFDDVKDVKVGDVITMVDGVPIEKLRENYARYFAASTTQSLMRSIHRDLLRGHENSRKKLTVRGVDGSIREVEVVTSIAATDPRWAKIDNKEKLLPVFTVLPSGYGYVDLSRLSVAEVNKMFETVKSAPAVIFDMRGYPLGTAWEIAPRLTEKKNVTAAMFSRPIWTAKELGGPDFANGANFTFGQTLPEPKGEVYKGKVVMLIDEKAISQSEHTAMFFEVATDVTFIGTPTAGANGDVTRLVLPGNLTIGFSGHDVRHADGRQLQRVGIQPNIKVAPTIRGLLIENRDEVLEAAIKFLQSNKTKQ
ncbi:MAG TPA: S41 family peptidase [Pyrinomonadaceae bacterium]|jgi:C-terminal processing protease CtpA/Prc